MKILLWIWQLPQNLLGVLLIHIFQCVQSSTYYVTTPCIMTGIALGNYIIIRADMVRDIVLKHEQGHQKQSLYLGWLYLIVIGLPSFVGNIVHRFVRFDYYKQPWADKLGGVVK